MYSGFEIPAAGIHHHHHPRQQQTDGGDNSNCVVVPADLVSMNQTSSSHSSACINLEQTHDTQQLLLIDQQHHFFPPQTRLQSHHHHYGAAASFLPAMNFKLGGLNSNYEIMCCTRNYNYSNCKQDCNNYQVTPEARPYASLGHYSWQNQQDSPPPAIKKQQQQQQQPFWEPLPPSEVSNENSDIVDMRQDQHLEMNQQKEAALITNSCLEITHDFSELEAIYKRLSTSESNPTQTRLNIDSTEANSTGDQEAAKYATKLKRKKEKRRYNDQMIDPMADFIENLVKQVINHQENLHNKFNEVIERLDFERREREEAWRNQELEHFEKEAKERAHDRFLAQNREAIIVSYLEKITGQNIKLPTLFRPNSEIMGTMELE